ncbi:carbohydrate porin [Thalassoglobus sp.]|uniref:carbohydrate porin n=1 Tax=Thalassoglobus sp. TaxID=2795869 RepID=UPI003AA8F664
MCGLSGINLKSVLQGFWTFGIAIAVVASSQLTMADEASCLFGDPDLCLKSNSIGSGCDACCGVLDEGCFSTTSPYLTGDWGGTRTDLAESGITFQADLTTFSFGVVEGGLDRKFRYSGHGDYIVNIDAGKLGLQEGLFVKLRAEHRFGQTLDGSTGSFMPTTISSSLPVPDSDKIYLTNVLFTQAFSENFAVFFGKMDTLDGDANAFAHDRGTKQFSNLGMVVNPIVLRSVPYSTLGAGFVWMENGEPIFTFTLMNPEDTASTVGISDLFAEGISMAAELRLPTNFFGKPGHQLFAGTWSSRDYTSLGQDPRIILPNVPINQTSGSWSMYYNFDQYLVTDPCDPTRGWGVFGRAGLGDDEANPLAWFLSFGVGGSSPLPGRKNDGFGAGWYYNGISDEIGPILDLALGGVSDGHGLELYYRAQITPWFDVTPDVQILFPGQSGVDTAYVMGLRSNISF